MRKVMGHITVSATQASSVTLIWQHGAKKNNSKFETLKPFTGRLASEQQPIDMHCTTRKHAFCSCKNKSTEQLHSQSKADQRLSYRCLNVEPVSILYCPVSYHLVKFAKDKLFHDITFIPNERVQVGNDEEKAQSE